jgi:HD-GYP domain-containing protein (c-di-GMP phosphodiesterase class II)
MSLAENHYLATDELVVRLGLGNDVRTSLRQSYERWDGKGPYGMKGEEILVASRLINLADVVEVFRRTSGVEGAIAIARERSGTQFDPALVEIFCEQAPMLLAELDAAPSWDQVIAAEPSLSGGVSGQELDAALEAIGDFSDLKSPWTIGHSRGVAELAAEAGHGSGVPACDVTTLRRASLVHDIGRLGVSNAVWDKRGALTAADVERVRLHPYLTERMLAFAPALAPLGAIAVQHHERLDGSGYPADSWVTRSRPLDAFWPRLTATTRSPRCAPTGRLAHPRRPRKWCARRSRRAAWTAKRLTPSSGRPVTGSGAGGNGPPA